MWSSPGGLGVGVMLLERGAVILALVAEDVAERLREPLPLAQADMEEMRRLVTHVSEHRAVELSELLLTLGENGIAGLADVDRDRAVRMAHRDGVLARRGLLGQHPEDRPFAWIVRPEPAPAAKGGEHPAFGAFGLGPEHTVPLLAAVGHDFGHRAGAAEAALLSAPVAADLVPVAAIRTVDRHRLHVRIEDQRLPAGAGQVVEVDARPAGGTGEDLHDVWGRDDCAQRRSNLRAHRAVPTLLTPRRREAGLSRSAPRSPPPRAARCARRKRRPRRGSRGSPRPAPAPGRRPRARACRR